METLSNTYAITAFAPKEIDLVVSLLKKKYHTFIEQEKTQEENVITKNVAHVTMMNSFSLQANVTEDSLLFALSDFQFKKVTIIAKDVGIFATKKHGNVLVLLLEKTPELLAVHNDLNRRIAPLVESSLHFDGNGFTPHLSVFYTLQKDLCQDGEKDVRKLLLPLVYQLESMSLLKDVLGVKRERSFLHKYVAL